MSKQDAYPAKSTLAANDYVTGVDSTGPSTIKILISAILSYVWTLANIPTGATSPITRDSESQFPFVASGGIWTADAAGSTKNASMTALFCYINGRRIPVAAVTARTFTASVDTYIDVLDNGDGTGTLVYTTAVNNAASPALAANSIRIGIIVTGATTIAAASSINQGQPTAVLPIASSIPYVTTDSLGNLINPRDPARVTLGYTEKATGQGGITTAADITGMSLVVKIPSNCYNIQLSAEAIISSATAATTATLSIADGSNVVQVQRTQIIVSANAAALQTVNASRNIAVVPGNTYTFKLRATGTSTVIINNGDTTSQPTILRVTRA